MAGMWRAEENGSKVTPDDVTAAALRQNPLAKRFCLEIQGNRCTRKGAFEDDFWGANEGFMRYGGVMAKPQNYSLNDSIQATTARLEKPCHGPS
jgi:hypothetical protein